MSALPLLQPNVSAAFSKHLDDEYTAATVFAYRAALRKFLTYCQANELEPAELSRRDIIRWRDSLSADGAAPNAVRLRLAALRCFYEWARGQGLDLPNPAADVHLRGRQSAAPRQRAALTDDQVCRLLETCDDSPTGRREHAILTLMLYCGLRTIEVQRADLGDLGTHQGRLVLAVWGKGRAGPDETVILPQAAEIALRAWLAARSRQGGPLFISFSSRTYGQRLGLAYLRKMIHTRCRRAGISGPAISAHSLRHTAITKAIESGLHPVKVQRFARHADVKTTLGYYHERDRMKDPVEDHIAYAGRDQLEGRSA